MLSACGPFPKNSVDAPVKASLSQGSITGARYPDPVFLISVLMMALYGGSRVTSFYTTLAHVIGSTPGGRRIDSSTFVFVRSTFPAFARSGIPSQPVMLSVGL